MNNASFWAEAQLRTKKVLDEVGLLRQALRDKSFLKAQHLFVRMRASADSLHQLFSGGLLVVGSDDPDHAIFGALCFVKSREDYPVLQRVFANEPQRALDFVEVWHGSLEVMITQCKEAQKKAAALN